VGTPGESKKKALFSKQVSDDKASRSLSVRFVHQETYAITRQIIGRLEFDLIPKL